MTISVLTSPSSVAAPLVGVAAVAWGPSSAAAALADARRPDRAPPLATAINVVSTIDWNPRRLLSFAACWELEGLARSA